MESNRFSQSRPVCGDMEVETSKSCKLQPPTTGFNPVVSLTPVAIDHDYHTTPVAGSTSGNYADWSNLPAVPLAIVYAQLEDADRKSAAAVCKMWRDAFYTPSLWRERTYRFFCGYSSNTKEIENMLGYSKKFGNYLRCLHLICEQPTRGMCKELQKGFSVFFTILMWKNTELKHFQFNNLEVDRYWRYDAVRKRLVTAFCRFLRRQSSLECFEMNNATFPPALGIRIAENLARLSGDQISVLNMEDFFSPKSSMYCTSELKLVMTKFSNLTTMQTNYNYMSEDILLSLCRNCARSLSSLSLKVHRLDPHMHRIGNDVWKACRRLCPELGVSVNFEGVGHHDDLVGIMNPEMPLKTMSVWTGVRLGDDWAIKESLAHMARCFCKTLEDVSLSLDAGQEVIDREILKLLETGLVLEHFELEAPIAVDTLETVCKMQQEFKIALQTCHVTCERLTEDDISRLRALEEKYDTLFYDRGVDFRFYTSEYSYEF